MEGCQGTQDEGGQAGAVVECVGVALQDPGSEHGQGLCLGGERREHRQCVGQQGSGSFRRATDQTGGSARGGPVGERGLGPYGGVAVQPCPQLGAFAFSAAPFTRAVVKGADEFGDGFAHRTAAQLGDGLFQTDQGDGGAGVRQTVQAEEVGEGLALGVVERSETHPCDGPPEERRLWTVCQSGRSSGRRRVCSPGAVSGCVIPPPGRCRSRRSGRW